MMCIFSSICYAQQKEEASSKYAFGLAYGFGNEFKNRNYSYTNNYVQAQLYYNLNSESIWKYTIALQPEINFGTHQLLNLYFVTPDSPDYENKRARFTQLKDTREYILNVAFFVKKNISMKLGIYAMANIGPMLIDTETERLAKGFAFCDVLALGVNYNFGGILLDVRPNVRHVSNAGLNRPNAGYNSLNIAFSVIVPIKP